MTIELTSTYEVAPVERAGNAETIGAAGLAAADRYTGAALTGPGGTVDYAAFGTAIREIAGGLTTLGVEVGDRVAILAATRAEGTLADFGALCAGAVVVPIYHTNSPEECAYVLAHSGARVAICEDPAQAAKLAAVRDELPALEHIVLMEGDAEGTLGLGELRRRGAQAGDVC